MKEEQKQHLIDIIEKDEELGLYDIFNEEKRQGVKELIDKHKLEEASWKFNPLKKLDGEFLRHAFKEGAKWQMDKQDNFIIGFLEFIEGTYSYSNIFDYWYLHADTSKTYTKKELLKKYNDTLNGN